MSNKSLHGLLLRLGCLFIHTWHFVDHDSICITGNILKLNNLYTSKESSDVDIVRLVDVYQDTGYLYCTLYFFKRNQIITISQVLQPGSFIIWQIMDDRDYDEIMSRNLWREVNELEELLEFDF